MYTEGLDLTDPYFACHSESFGALRINSRGIFSPTIQNERKLNHYPKPLSISRSTDHPATNGHGSLSSVRFVA